MRCVKVRRLNDGQRGFKKEHSANITSKKDSTVEQQTGRRLASETPNFSLNVDSTVQHGLSSKKDLVKVIQSTNNVLKIHYPTRNYPVVED